VQGPRHRWTVERLVEVLHVPKQLAGRPGWYVDGRNLALLAPVSAQSGIVLGGVSLRIRTRQTRPEEDVSVMLLVEHSNKPRPFARVDWRGSAHINKPTAPEPWSLVDAGNTHFHDTELHRDLSLDQLLDPRLNLPIARPLDEPESWTKLLDLCETLLRVKGLGGLPPPPWAGELLDG
jgi:hypothetical protein